MEHGVLIETLWNVKVEQDNISRLRSDRINRNIVECKDVLYVCHEHLSFVLIETLWNVKIFPCALPVLVCCINRNIVECKDFN